MTNPHARITQRHWLPLLALGLVLSVSQASAQSTQNQGIQVIGEGQAKAKPTAVQINARVSGQAQLAGDAIVKFRDNKRRALDALKKAKVENLSTEAQGFSVDTAINPQAMQQMMMGQQQKMPEGKITIAEPVRITLGAIDQLDEKTLIDRITKVLDLANDNGLSVGPTMPSSPAMMNLPKDTTLARFVLDDRKELRNQAYKQAITDARTKAKRLAKLSDVKLGKVLSIQEAPATSDDQTDQANPYLAMIAQAMGADQQSPSGAKNFGKVSVKVNLVVRFAIQ